MSGKYPSVHYQQREHRLCVFALAICIADLAAIVQGLRCFKRAFRTAGLGRDCFRPQRLLALPAPQDIRNNEHQTHDEILKSKRKHENVHSVSLAIDGASGRTRLLSGAASVMMFFWATVLTFSLRVLPCDDRSQTSDAQAHNLGKPHLAEQTRHDLKKTQTKAPRATTTSLHCSRRPALSRKCVCTCLFVSRWT